MPYSSWTQLKMPLNLDGTVGIFGGTGGFGAAQTLLTQAQMDQLNSESPAFNATVATSQDLYFVFLFPELRDLAAFIARCAVGAGGNSTADQFATSPDTTNGLDGTWTTVTISGTKQVTTNNVDWWRANTPATFSGAAASGVKGLRFHISNNLTSQDVRGVHVFGTKTSGQTADDIQFLDSNGSTVSTSDYDFGDIAVGGTTADTTIYVKNASGTKTANNLALQFTGSNPGDFLMSIDGGSNFFTSRTLATLASGATQQVIVRVTTPALASGVATPRAANLRATVGSWT